MCRGSGKHNNYETQNLLSFFVSRKSFKVSSITQSRYTLAALAYVSYVPIRRVYVYLHTT